jgi:hypothetical protein
MRSANPLFGYAIALLCCDNVVSQSSTTSLPVGAAPSGNASVQVPTSTSAMSAFTTTLGLSLDGI